MVTAVALNPGLSWLTREAQECKSQTNKEVWIKMIALLNIWFISLYMIRFFTRKQEFSKSRPHAWRFLPGLILYLNPSVCVPETSDWTGFHLCVCVLLFLHFCFMYFKMNTVNLNVTNCCSTSLYCTLAPFSLSYRNTSGWGRWDRAVYWKALYT